MAGDAAVTAVPVLPMLHCAGWWEGHPTGPHACGLNSRPGAWSPAGPWSRVVVTGPPRTGDRAAVWAALTSAWREAGQPLLVMAAGRPYPPDVHAAEWLAEHELCGHRLESCAQLLEVDPWRVLSFGPDDVTVLAGLRRYDVCRVEVAGVKR